MNVDNNAFSKGTSSIICWLISLDSRIDAAPPTSSLLSINISTYFLYIPYDLPPPFRTVFIPVALQHLDILRV